MFSVAGSDQNSVMAGLVPAIHVPAIHVSAIHVSAWVQGVDIRHLPGTTVLGMVTAAYTTMTPQ